MEQRDELLLQLAREVDEQVAAGEQVELGERRVHDDVLRREHHHLADLLADPEAALLLDEEAAQALGRDVGGDAVRVDAHACPVDGLAVEVGGEDLQGQVAARPVGLHRLAEDHGQRVGLLAGGAARDPGAQHAAGGAAGEQRRQHLPLQVLPGRRVAEEAGDADEQLLEQQVDLAGVVAQEAHVVGDGVDLVQAHAPLDAAVEGALLVEREVVAGLRAQQDEDLLQGALRLLLERDLGAPEVRGVLAVGDDPARQLLDRGHHVGQVGVDGAAGHSVELGRGERLHEGGAGLLLDGAQAQRAVGAHAREDDADGPLLLVFSQGAQEEVDGQVEPPRRDLRQQVQGAVEHRHVLVGRDDVDVIALDPLAVGGLLHGHLGRALQQLDQHPLVGRVQVLDDHERHAGAGGDVLEELLEGLQAAGGGAEAHDRKGGGEPGAGFLARCRGARALGLVDDREHRLALDRGDSGLGPLPGDARRTRRPAPGAALRIPVAHS
ncbi:MAG: hypothetical protein QM765_38340 [Myxococcales bacterium]